MPEKNYLLMDQITTELVGNPISLMAERIMYLMIGIFFLVAIFKGLQLNPGEDD
tara:strand:- start:332 stop:493 length:162 start_codon:yes stop_codon:yes gene_type:complete